MDQATDRWDWALLRRRARLEAGRVLDSPHDAEDATQEALLRAWRARHDCAGRPAAWVAVIARNEALRVAARPMPTPVDEPLLVAHGRMAVPPADDQVITVLDVRAALDRLGPYDRLVLALRYRADMTAREVATAIGSTESTVRVRQHRARKMVGALLKEQA